MKRREFVKDLFVIFMLGYDPLFYLPQFGKTMAEITLDEKNQISHRGKALKKLVEMLP